MTTNVGRHVVSHEAPCWISISCVFIKLFHIYVNTYSMRVSPSHLGHSCHSTRLRLSLGILYTMFNTSNVSHDPRWWWIVCRVVHLCPLVQIEQGTWVVSPFPHIGGWACYIFLRRCCLTWTAQIVNCDLDVKIFVWVVNLCCRAHWLPRIYQSWISSTKDTKLHMHRHGSFSGFGLHDCTRSFEYVFSKV